MSQTPHLQCLPQLQPHTLPACSRVSVCVSVCVWQRITALVHILNAHNFCVKLFWHANKCPTSCGLNGPSSPSVPFYPPFMQCLLCETPVVQSAKFAGLLTRQRCTQGRAQTANKSLACSRQIRIQMRVMRYPELGLRDSVKALPGLALIKARLCSLIQLWGGLS